MKDQTIVIDLDAIFDTRIGTIAGINPVVAVAIIANDVYRNRESEDWEVITEGAITNEEFNAAYAARNKETLQRSVITAMPKIIGDFTKSLQWKGIIQIDVDKVSIKVNLWPYKFTSEEKRTLRDCMAQYTSATATIEFVRISMEEMTPHRLDSLGDIWITYGYNEWMAYHTENLVKYRIPLMTLLCPKLLHNPEAFNETDLIDAELKGTFDPFMVHQVTMCEFLGVEFYPPFSFSAVLDD